MENAMSTITSALSTVIDWIGTVVNSIFASDGALNVLLPLFAVGIAISGVLLAVKVVRGLVWGA